MTTIAISIAHLRALAAVSVIADAARHWPGSCDRGTGSAGEGAGGDGLRRDPTRAPRRRGNSRVELVTAATVTA